MSIFDADRIISRSDETGVKVSVCHQNRFNMVSRSCEAPWRKVGLEGYPTGLSMCAGTEEGSITLSGVERELGA
jgi:hypothetical protein